MAPAGPVDAKAYAADLIARAPKLGIGDTIGQSWELLKDISRRWSGRQSSWWRWRCRQLSI